MVKKNLILSLAAFGIMGCSGHTEPVTKRASTALRPHQISFYQTNNTKALMEAISKILQEEGFSIKTIHYDLGFVSATKKILKEEAVALASEEYQGPTPDTLELTANLIQKDDLMKVKIHFVTKSLDDRGIVRALEMVGEEKIYKEFFSKISRHIHIETEPSLRL